MTAPVMVNEPDAATLARIEATKEALRAAKERKDRERDGPTKRYVDRDEAPPDPKSSTTGARQALKEFRRVETNGNGSCPDCGTPYGKRKRCFKCKPGGRVAGQKVAAKARPETEPEPRPPLVVHAPEPTRAASAAKELRAMSSIVGALDVLDAASARRVLAWVNGHYGASS